MSKTTLIAAGAVGYVLGARAGRDRYDEIVTAARKVARDPRVQSAKDRAADTARTQATAAAEVAREKAGDVAAAAKDKMSSDDAASPTGGPVATQTTTQTPL
ncbi:MULTISPECIES: hypothetical protein [Nocardioides]|uniref:hypothetical protein n=2 Tax=Nocardioidaceae TaxID=85015 RepID=UPI000702C80F|nr:MULTISPECIES: hypothetical protein [Nocardioides]KQP66367.1 hypothetical protein ASF47_00670 [Nocardioides sp. Leaf285]KQQ41926.1 hypothetical protein ASF50_13675 [Nocardioides sp. Leaf307]MBJ7528759.1 hypothetical protein [Nocardioides sp.]MCM3514517.1 hypothetical protein [Nocardioides sp. P86]